MKYTLTLLFIITYFYSFSQTKNENQVLNLSKKLFNWEIANSIDSIDNLLAAQFVVVNSKGETQNKQQYLATFSAGNMVHNSIDIEAASSTIVNNTAIITGKGIFNITFNGNNLIRHLSYIETFINTNNGWKLLALKASVLPN